MNDQQMYKAPAIWVDRTELLPKSLAYVFSLDVQFEFAGNDDPAPRGHLQALKPPPKGTLNAYHVLGEAVTSGEDGLPREVPQARLERGDGWIVGTGNGMASIDVKLTLLTDIDARISMACSGVMSLKGGIEQLFLPGERKTISGSSQIATRHEADRPAYRWLVRGQLVGVGKVTAEPVEKSKYPWLFRFAYDL